MPETSGAEARRVVLIFDEGEPGRPTALAGCDTDAFPVAGVEAIGRPATLGALRDLVRASDADLLLVSDRALITPRAVAALRAGLASDSACATVSVVDDSAPSPPGIPPPGRVTPVVGLVLVRRDHLLLALDEAELTEGAARPQGTHTGPGLIGRVLATLTRPGFVHRGVTQPGVAPGSDPSARPSSRHHVRPRCAATDIVLDGRCLGYPLSGTQVQLLGLAGGLVRAGARVAVMRPPEVHPSLAPILGRLANEILLIERSQVRRPAILHRPFQMWSLKELADCLTIGERLVLTHQDMILDRTPAYASSIEVWNDYRRTTHAALSSADELGFFSHHAAADAASDGHVDLDRATVVPLGVDHLTTSDEETVADPLGGRPYLLVLGNTYWHKNRLFTLRLLHWLIDREGWDGGLVLAGGDTGLGSSVGAEREFIRSVPSLEPRLADLGGVSEAERAALYRGAELVLFPSLYEGFGLIPFEAALFGTASAYTYRASMREFLPEAGALPSFDLDEAGPFVASLLRDRHARERIRMDVAKAAAGLTWDKTAAGYLDVYARALAREPRSVSRELVGIDPDVTEREARLLDVYRRRRVVRLAVDGAMRAVSSVRARRTSAS